MVLIFFFGRLIDLVVDVVLFVRSCVYSKIFVDCEGFFLFLVGFINENKDFFNMYFLNIWVICFRGLVVEIKREMLILCFLFVLLYFLKENIVNKDREIKLVFLYLRVVKRLFLLLSVYFFCTKNL